MGMTVYEEVEELGREAFRQLGPDECETWIQLPANPAYAVTGVFYLSERGPQLSGMYFAPWSRLPWPPPMLTKAMIRSVPVDQLYEQVRGYVAISPRIGVALDVDLTEFARNPRPGRRGRPDIFYAVLAAQYVELLDGRSAPTAALAELRNLSASQTRDLLHQARGRGLLTSPPRGRSGGELTEKAKKLLSKHRRTR
jgi:hypothetical protein